MLTKYNIEPQRNASELDDDTWYIPCNEDEAEIFALFLHGEWIADFALKTDAEQFMSLLLSKE